MAPPWLPSSGKSDQPYLKGDPIPRFSAALITPVLQYLRARAQPKPEPKPKPKATRPTALRRARPDPALARASILSSSLIAWNASHLRSSPRRTLHTAHLTHTSTPKTPGPSWSSPVHPNSPPPLQREKERERERHRAAQEMRNAEAVRRNAPPPNTRDAVQQRDDLGAVPPPREARGGHLAEAELGAEGRPKEGEGGAGMWRGPPGVWGTGRMGDEGRGAADEGRERGKGAEEGRWERKRRGGEGRGERTRRRRGGLRAGRRKVKQGNGNGRVASHPFLPSHSPTPHLPPATCHLPPPTSLPHPPQNPLPQTTQKGKNSHIRGQHTRRDIGEEDGEHAAAEAEEEDAGAKDADAEGGEDGVCCEPAGGRGGGQHEGWNEKNVEMEKQTTPQILSRRRIRAQLPRAAPRQDKHTIHPEMAHRGELFGVGAGVAIAGGFDGHGGRRRRFKLRKEPQRTVGFERGDAKHEAGETGLGARIARIYHVKKVEAPRGR
ncbi:hypothetical protein B0H14DRAFT_3767322 [Mycena olivaceomarginata]|nr:hypothetical protein B0H14DRAFT_3767322 [Mycena olivaceomarginata]